MSSPDSAPLTFSLGPDQVLVQVGTDATGAPLFAVRPAAAASGQVNKPASAAQSAQQYPIRPSAPSAVSPPSASAVQPTIADLPANDEQFGSTDFGDQKEGRAAAKSQPQAANQSRQKHSQPRNEAKREEKYVDPDDGVIPDELIEAEGEGRDAMEDDRMAQHHYKIQYFGSQAPVQHSQPIDRPASPSNRDPRLSVVQGNPRNLASLAPKKPEEKQAQDSASAAASAALHRAKLTQFQSHLSNDPEERRALAKPRSLVVNVADVNDGAPVSVQVNMPAHLKADQYAALAYLVPLIIVLQFIVPFMVGFAYNSDSWQVDGVGDHFGVQRICVSGECQSWGELICRSGTAANKSDFCKYHDAATSIYLAAIGFSIVALVCSAGRLILFDHVDLLRTSFVHFIIFVGSFFGNLISFVLSITAWRAGQDMFDELYSTLRSAAAAEGMVIDFQVSDGEGFRLARAGWIIAAIAGCFFYLFWILRYMIKKGIIQIRSRSQESRSQLVVESVSGQPPQMPMLSAATPAPYSPAFPAPAAPAVGSAPMSLPASSQDMLSSALVPVPVQINGQIQYILAPMPISGGNSPNLNPNQPGNAAQQIQLSSLYGAGAMPADRNYQVYSGSLQQDYNRA